MRGMLDVHDAPRLVKFAIRLIFLVDRMARYLFTRPAAALFDCNRESFCNSIVSFQLIEIVSFRFAPFAHNQKAGLLLSFAQALSGMALRHPGSYGTSKSSKTGPNDGTPP